MGRLRERLRRPEFEMGARAREEGRTERAPEPTSHDAILDLQRRAGNGAVSQLLRSMEPEREPALAVSADEHAEREADRIADAAVTALGRRALAPPTVSGALSPTLRRALAGVSPELVGLEQVRVRTDAAAHDETASINARAFTRGNDVSVAHGELTNPVEANRLVAHEAVHAARHQPSTEGNVVHAKLRGTRDAVVNMGGEKTTKGRLIKTNWDEIVDGLGAYEELEATVLAAGNPEPEELMKISPKMIKLLKRIESAGVAWKKANQGETKQQAKGRKNRILEKGDPDERDTRFKAERRQTVELVLTRVRSEIHDLQTGKWTQTLGLSDRAMVTEKGEKRGGMHIAKEMDWKTENGEFSGYFKRDKGFHQSLQKHEQRVGINQVDPNYGKRAVAMNRLDKLLGAGVTARAEFAVHKGQLGVVTETAKGTQAGQSSWASDKDQQEQQGPGSVLLSDEVFQRGINKLQILDAICGQLDRHADNWVVELDDKGKVKGVTGIDLDMAFGEDMTNFEGEGLGENYLALPPMIDAEFALALKKIKPDQIRDAIGGLLSKGEVEATVQRFEKVLKRINEIPEAMLIKEWNEDTAKRNQSKRQRAIDANSYAMQMSGRASERAFEDIEAAIKDALLGHGPPPFKNAFAGRMRNLPDKTVGSLRDMLTYSLCGTTTVKKRVLDQELPAGRAVEMAMTVMNQVLGDDRLVGRIELEVMEWNNPKASPVMEIQKWLYPLIADLVNRWIAANIR
ncbi:MAG TPA: DUF4157 domain-containing protein [Ilumatobacteraceae bacterium]|nr:DUF4157 domain-containing protein [Ilumatobacteraceae bacterium]